MRVLLTAALMLTSSIAMAECVKPDAPELPDGGTADMQAMVAGQKAVKTYVSGTDAYLACIAGEGQEAGAEANPDAEMERVDMHNAAVDEMEAVAAKFNEEIREYKAQAK